MRSVPPSTVNCAPSGNFFEAVTAAPAEASDAANTPMIKLKDRRFFMEFILLQLKFVDVDAEPGECDRIWNGING